MRPTDFKYSNYCTPNLYSIYLEKYERYLEVWVRNKKPNK